jgi:hypothetical protein
MMFSGVVAVAVYTGTSGLPLHHLIRHGGHETLHIQGVRVPPQLLQRLDCDEYSDGSAI